MKRDQRERNVFQIRVDPRMEKLDIREPGFFRLLQQQYATKYLEGLGVEPNQKNIAKVLRDNPLESCDIQESRLNGGLHTDTITITRRAVGVSSAVNDTFKPSAQLLAALNLKKMRPPLPPRAPKVVYSQVKTLPSPSVAIGEWNWSLQNLKKLYIYPFNMGYERLRNFRLRDTSGLTAGRKETGRVYEAKIFAFPFKKVDLDLATLRELETPIKAKMDEVMRFFDQFCEKAPEELLRGFRLHKNQFQNVKKQKQKEIQKNSIQHQTTLIQLRRRDKKEEEKIDRNEEGNDSEGKQITQAFTLLRSEECARLTGVLLHLAYWAVLGAVNPVQLDTGLRQKMFLLLHQSLQLLQVHAQSPRKWLSLVQPLLLLALKVALHRFFLQQFPRLFASPPAAALLLDKLLLFVQQLFDQANLRGRFPALQSEEPLAVSFEKRLFRKRLFGISPLLPIVLPQPTDGSARAILARNLQQDQLQQLVDPGPLTLTQTDPDTASRFLTFILLKIRLRLQDFLGSRAASLLQLTPD